MNKTNNKGFSLVELIVVIAIMAVLIGVMAPALIGNIEKSRESNDFNTLDAVYQAVKTAYGDEAGNKHAKKIADISTNGATLAAVLSSTTITSGETSSTNAFVKMLSEYLDGKSAADIQGELTSENAEGKNIMIKIVDSKITVWIANGDAVAEAVKTMENGSPKKFLVGADLTASGSNNNNQNNNDQNNGGQNGNQ